MSHGKTLPLESCLERSTSFERESVKYLTTHPRTSRTGFKRQCPSPSSRLKIL